MEVEKSQNEVWEWKEKVYEDIKNLSLQELKEYVKNTAEDFQKKYNLRFQTYKPLVPVK